MRRAYLFLLLALLLVLWLKARPTPEIVPQNQTCNSTSCPWPATNEQLFQREQQKQYLEQH